MRFSNLSMVSQLDRDRPWDLNLGRLGVRILGLSILTVCVP